MGIKEKLHKASVNFLAYEGRRWTETPVFTEDGWKRYVAAGSRGLLRSFHGDEAMYSAYVNQTLQHTSDLQREVYEQEHGTALSNDEWIAIRSQQRQREHPAISEDEWKDFELGIAILESHTYLMIEAPFIQKRGQKGEVLTELEEAASQVEHVDGYFLEELSMEFPEMRRGSIVHFPSHPRDFIENTTVGDRIERTIRGVGKKVAHIIYDATAPRSQETL